MNKYSDNVVITMITFYNPDKEDDSVRMKIARRTIKKAVDLKYDVLVVDGGSPKDFLEELVELGVKVFTQTSEGMGNGKRQVIGEAYKLKKDIILYTEPEKEDFILKIDKVVTPLIEKSADVAVPKRKSLESYPIDQQCVEKLQNMLWKRVTGTDLDITFGPTAWKRDVTNYFLDYKGDYGDKWDSIYIPLMNMIKDNKKLESVEIDFTYPQEQRKFEEENWDFFKKRIMQLNEKINCLENHWKRIH